MDHLALSSSRLELVEGNIRERLSGPREHSRIQSNINRCLLPALDERELEFFGPDQSVRISPENYFFPDGLIARSAQFGAFRDFDALLNPIVVFEVLSRESTVHDLATKLPQYRKLMSLQVIIAIDSAQPWIELSTRRSDGSWTVRDLFLNDELELEVIGLRVPVRELYHRVSFDSAEN